MLLSNIIVILSRPAEAGNVGAVCRAMKNMGLSRLRLVAREFSSGEAFLSEAGFGYGGTEAIIRARSVHAFDVWESAETFDTLSDAVKDCSLVVGTTRRRGRRRKQVSMTPPELGVFLKGHSGQAAGGHAAVVFGNERTGLEDDELELCNMASHIPVDESFPSINLSHAVQIYTYEIFKALSVPIKETVKGQWVPLDQAAIEAKVTELMDILQTLGFYKKIGREEQGRFFMDIFSRAGITEWESSYFSNIIAKAARLGIKNAVSDKET